MISNNLVDHNLRRRVALRTNGLINKASRLFPETTLNKPQLFYGNLGDLGGIALWNSKTNEFFVIFNANMLNNQPDLYIESVVPHEIAHIIAMNHYGSKYSDKAPAHGILWKNILTELKCSPKAQTWHHPMRTSGFKPYKSETMIKDLHHILTEHNNYSITKSMYAIKLFTNCSTSYIKKVIKQSH